MKYKEPIFRHDSHIRDGSTNIYRLDFDCDGEYRVGGCHSHTTSEGLARNRHYTTAVYRINVKVKHHVEQPA